MASESDDNSTDTEPSAASDENIVIKTETDEATEKTSEKGASVMIGSAKSGEETGEAKAKAPVIPYGPTVSQTKKEEKTDGEEAPKCTYRDFSRVPPDPKEGATRKGKRTKEPTFPSKLHMILSNPDFQDVICWLPHGRSWRILQQKAFEERIIPLFFRHGRYSSFARQVNGWGFKRVTHGSDYNSYYHEMFLRGLPHLCLKMRRLTPKDSASRAKTAEGDDEHDFTPDFYAISRAYPVPESPVMMPIQGLPSSVAADAALAGLNPADILSLEASIMERQRAEIMERLRLIEAANAVTQQDQLANAMAARQQRDPFASLMGLPPMRQQQQQQQQQQQRPMFPMGGVGAGGMGGIGAGAMNPMLGLGGLGLGAMGGITPNAALSNQFLLNNAAQMNNAATLEAELLAARAGGNPDLSFLLAMQGIGGGLGGFKGPPPKNPFGM